MNDRTSRAAALSTRVLVGTIPRAGDTDIVLTGFPRLIRTRAAAYTFLPSLLGLRWLAAM
jgi:hypothetical protein